MKRIIFFVFLVIIIGGVLVAYKTYDETINYVAEINDPVQFTVVEGDNFTTLLDELQSKGLIKNKQVIQVYLSLNDINPNVKIGTYTIESDIDLPRLIEILEKGVFKPGVRVTIREGLRSDQIADLLEAELSTSTGYSNGEFVAFVNNPAIELLSEETRLFLSTHLPAGKSLEGFLFPDTYEFSPEQTTMQILNVMLGNFVTKVSADIDFSNIDTGSQTPTLYSGLTLASIVEKEASGNDKKEVISSVFHNRLRDGMRLESDATVNYVTKKNDAAPLIADTLIESPYNTYRSDGLPPTPINNPGLASIKAALFPDQTGYYFFFHDDAGNSYLSTTYNEHLIKVDQIRGFN